MTDENDDMMKQMSDVLSRLEGRLDWRVTPWTRARCQQV